MREAIGLGGRVNVRKPKREYKNDGNIRRENKTNVGGNEGKVELKKKKRQFAMNFNLYS